MKEQIEKIILDNRKLVYKVIGDTNLYWKTADEYQEIVDAGVLGLILGARSYDGTIGKESTFLYKCIKNEIFKHLMLSNMKKRKNIYGDNISLDQNINDGIDLTFESMLEDPNVNVEKEVLWDIERQNIHAILNTMEDKYSYLLKAKYGIGYERKTNYVLAKEYKCSLAYLGYLIRKAKEIFKREYLRNKDEYYKERMKGNLNEKDNDKSTNGW